MKVLFAVSSENISDAIIKRYQKQYKEILSYKNVYYFNAILKEIQKDKTYDRIIISEDLEPFSNNNYDTIDKFIFEKLDSISDEAEDSSGKETSIILICTDRRQKGNSILVKLFGIGVYNALLGNDRSMEEVCKLINRPRTKKEAKLYYRIDTDDVNYKAENENEVSEVEIQNILAHFKKLGKNTAKYSESFNNIAVQYNDEQLKIIVNCLPINVKAILESECERYQELMAVTSGIRSVKNMAATSDDMENAVKQGIKSRNVGQAGNITKPIVIPSAVRNAKNKAQVLKSRQQPSNVVRSSVESNVNQETVKRPVQVNRPVEKVSKPEVRVPAEKSNLTDNQENINKPEPMQENIIKPIQNEQVRQETVSSQTVGYQRPRRPVPGMHNNIQPQVQQELTEESVEEFNLSGFDDEYIEKNEDILSGVDEVKNDTMLPGIDDIGEVEDIVQDTSEENFNIDFEGSEEEIPSDDDITAKRGRGRPRKTPVEGAVLRPKGKRGRPRKNQEEEQFDEDIEMLPGLELEDDNDTLLPGIEEDDTDSLLPGIEEDDTDSLLPGIEEDNADSLLPGIEEDNADSLLPGIEENDRDSLLPGIEEDNNDILLPEIEEDDNDSLLPGIEDYSETVETDNLEDTFDDNATILPGMGFEDETEDLQVSGNDGYTDEVDLPGLEGLDDLDDIDISGTNNQEFSEDGDLDDLLNGVNNNTQQELDYDLTEDNSDLLPGINNDSYGDELNSTNGLIDETEEDNFEEDELLPGIGNYEDVNQDPIQSSVMTSNTVESIKPRVDYSMSSLNSLITKDKKIVTFIGTSKNGVSFLVNNLAALFSSLGINTAILDMTKNKNSYYIYTKNEDELRNIAFNSIEKLQNGYAEGIRVDKNLTVYTALPNDGKDYSNAEPILSTLIQNHTLVLIDCDYNTDLSYFASCQEMYLVQSMDILTIQPLTAFLRELKTNGILEPEKIRIVINKELKVRSLSIKAIIGGLSYYNDPAMSFMTELFNKDMVKACTLPFEDNAYSKYLEGIVNCNISIRDLSKQFMSKLRVLGDMVYPLVSKQTYGKGQMPSYNPNAFSNSMNDTLNKMRKKY